MRKDNIFYGKLITGLLCIFLGVLFMINSSMLMRISFTVAGALLVACGIYLIINKRVAEGCIALTAGAVIIVFGWTLLNVLFIVVGVGLIIVSVCALVKKQVKTTVGWVRFGITLTLGILLALGYIGADWIFILIGAVIVLYGISVLAELIKK